MGKSKTFNFNSFSIFFGKMPYEPLAEKTQNLMEYLNQIGLIKLYYL